MLFNQEYKEIFAVILEISLFALIKSLFSLHFSENFLAHHGHWKWANILWKLDFNCMFKKFLSSHPNGFIKSIQASFFYYIFTARKFYLLMTSDLTFFSFEEQLKPKASLQCLFFRTSIKICFSSLDDDVWHAKGGIEWLERCMTDNLITSFSLEQQSLIIAYDSLKKYFHFLPKEIIEG